MSVFDDVRYGVRTLAKSPGFAAVAVTALALGIGVNATVFALANAVLFKNLPFDDSDRILYINSTRSGTDRQLPVSYPDLRDFRAQSKAFEALGGGSQNAANVSDGNNLPDRFRDFEMTANGFATIGVKPILGRDFLPEDEKAGAPPVMILSYGMWQDRYGSDPNILRRSIRVNEVPTAVVGVMPKGVRFPTDSDFWIPYADSAANEKRESRSLMVFGRLARGSNIAAARAEMSTIAQRLSAEYPQSNKEIGVMVQSFTEQFNGGPLRTVFLALMGAVGFVLLIACANVANLMLARAVGRSREISIRAALGAGRWRVIRQLLVESLLLSIAGGVLGWLIAAWGVPTFDRVVIPFGKPSYIVFTMDYSALIYLALITIGTGILFGLAPALRLSKIDVNSALKEGGRGSAGSGRGRWLSAFLVVTEMALAVVLLAGAGLMIRSFFKLYNAQLGINTANVMTMRVDLPAKKYDTAEKQLAFYDQLQTKLASLPGVEAATLMSNLPSQGGFGFAMEIEGAPPVDARHRPNAIAVAIDSSYFRVMQAPVLRGREFTASDGVSGPPVAIVNTRFVTRHFNGGDALGKRFRVFRNNAPQPWLTIVGVVPEIAQADIRGDRDPLFYFPHRQDARRWFAAAVRSSTPPATLGQAMRKAVQSLDENLPVFQLRTLDDQIQQATWPYRVFGSLFTIFAAIALGLASVGLYAVIAHSVNQRTQEIGVRLALGASSSRILRMVFAQGAKQLAIGLPIGLLAAFGVTRVLQGVLVNISPTDPATFTIVALVLAAAAMLGCAAPALRAIRVDPVEALRNE